MLKAASKNLKPTTLTTYWQNWNVSSVCGHYSHSELATPSNVVVVTAVFAAAGELAAIAASTAATVIRVRIAALSVSWFV